MPILFKPKSAFIALGVAAITIIITSLFPAKANYIDETIMHQHELLTLRVKSSC